MLLQAATLHRAQVALTDIEKASKIQHDLKQLASIEAHDQQVARWLKQVSEEEWDDYGDQLEQPISTDDFVVSPLEGVLLFGAHVQGYKAGHAAALRSTCGEAFTPWCCSKIFMTRHIRAFCPIVRVGREVWRGSDTEASRGQISKVAAQLKALYLRLLAAQQLGFSSVTVQAPNSRPLIQVSPHSCTFLAESLLH